MILPPATIGMVGGGQLGRMFSIAASYMGYNVVVLCGGQNEPAAQVAHKTVVADLSDMDAVSEFAKQCDVITLEFENIPAETIAKCNEFAPTYPNADVLAIAQDRLREKSTLSRVGLPVTPFAEVSNEDELCEFGQQHGWPLIVKTSRSGYDGKGQHRVDSADAAGDVPWADADSWTAEKCISFTREVSVVVARNVSGETACFPVFENDHVNHILDTTIIPAAIDDALKERAADVAIRATETLGVVGLLCVEMFVVDDADVMINEVAPRPHNSGHVTIEANHTSQFQQHVRAICGLPFGDTGLKCGGGAMVNLLGDLWAGDGTAPDWKECFSVSDAQLHLYGKQDAKPGRKMGHVTVVAETPSAARDRAQLARTRLRG